MLNWTEDLVTGNQEMDIQHQEMFRKADQIFSLKDPAQMADAMNFLITYVIEHFSHEENVMIRNHYTDFIQHREHHTYFIVEIYKLNKALHEKGLTDSVLILLKALLVDWLINHIHEQDKKLAQTLRTQCSSCPSA